MELFETLADALTAYRLVIWPLLSLMMLIIVIIRWWDRVEYFFAKLAIGFPFIGLVARSARQAQETVGDTPWYHSERELCARYYRFYERANKDAAFFDKCANYLNKLEERGRKPTGIALWIASIFLVLLEAFIFALVLAPFIANNISANQAEFSALVISVLIGTILVPATHLMGAEIHKNGLIKKARLWFEQAKKSGKAQPLQRDSQVDLAHSDKDDNAPNYLHIINRVPHNARVTPVWWKTTIAIVLISVLAIGAYLIRASTINSLETELVNASPFASAPAQTGSMSIGPFTLPGGAAQDNQQADQRAVDEVLAERIFAYKLTFIILSVIFVGVQIIGVLIGVMRSYAGSESKEAARYIAGFNSRQEFAAYYKRKRDQVTRDADMHLNRLQHGIERHNDIGGSNNESTVPRNFGLYVTEELGNAKQEENRRLTQETRLPPSQSVPLTMVPTPQTQPLAPQVTPLTQTAVPPAPTEASDPTMNVSTSDDSIQQLGDLTAFTPEELASIAQELGLDAAHLLSRQKVQRAIARTKQGS